MSAKPFYFVAVQEMAERKLHQLQKTIRQLELAGGGRNVEMRREFNGLLGQYLAR